MKPIILLFLISLLSKARTRRDKFKLAMVNMTVIAQQNGHANAANLRRMARTTSSDDLVVHLLTCLREEPTRVNDPHNYDMSRKILWGNEKQFRRMFRLSRDVFETVLAETWPYLTDSNSRNSEQNISACFKLGIEFYCMAHGGDAIHLEAASAASDG